MYKGRTECVAELLPFLSPMHCFINFSFTIFLQRDSKYVLLSRSYWLDITDARISADQIDRIQSVDEKSGGFHSGTPTSYIIYIPLTRKPHAPQVYRDMLTLPVLQIQVREKWRTHYGHEWLDLTACGATYRRRSCPLRPIRAPQTRSSYFRPRYAHTFAQG
jgi:hypothetical protein